MKFGKAPNGLAYAFVAYSNAKLKAENELPADLKGFLQEKGYFTKLKTYIEDPRNRDSLTITEGREDRKRVSEIGEIWSDAISSTVSARLETKYPGYDKIKNPSLSQMKAEKEFHKKLLDQVDQAIWAQTSEWKNVEKQFEDVRMHFVEYLKSLKTIPQETKLSWLKKINTVKLVLPSSNTDPDCASTMVNASYFPYLHEFTVCAGRFNGSPYFQSSIAHELAHSLDPGKEVIEMQRKSELHQVLFNLNKELCEQASESKRTCPSSWKQISESKSLEGLVGSVGTWSPPVPSFYECLRNKTLQPVDPVYLKKFATQSAHISASRYADRQAMLRLTKPVIINENQEQIKNIRYLNPCGADELTQKEFNPADNWKALFVASYLCNTKGTGAERIERSASEAIRIDSVIQAQLTPMGGEYSNNRTMISSGYAEDIGERFADSLGYAVVARLLKFKSQDFNTRSQIFHVSSSLFCNPPTLEEMYPEEAQAQKAFSYEPHSQGQQRRKEFLTKDIREVLGCEQKSQLKDCSL